MPRSRRLAFVLVFNVLGASGLPAATLSYSTTDPVPGSSDVSNLVRAALDRDNIGGNGANDGLANDAITYVAADRYSQGQTFKTKTGANAYKAKAVWLRNVSYTGNTSATYWRTQNGGNLTARITNPAAANTGAFVLDAEIATATGTESGTPNGFAPQTALQSNTSGTGVWMRIGFDTPVTLAPNTTYGFDVASKSSNFFFETAGIRDVGPGGNPYAGGAAYNGSTVGAPDNALNSLAGDRTFVVELEAADAPIVPQPSRAVPFPLERVRLLDSRFKSNQELHRTGYLAWIDPNRLLYPFRENAGLSQTAGATSLGGWEGGAGLSTVRGHMGGHYLSAASKMYAATGDASFLTKVNYLVTELKKCQDALGAQETAAGRSYGYLSAFPISYFDSLETNPSGPTYYVPFYTIHKILAGLVDAYVHCGSQQALDMAIAMSDYHRWRVARLSANQIEAMFRTDNGNTEEWGGMNETLSEIYRLSLQRGDANPDRHLEFARIFHRDWFVTPLANNLDRLAGLHANTHIPQVVGFAHVASILGSSDPERQRLYDAAANFWQIVTSNHSFVIGGNSFGEHFNEPGKETGLGGSALQIGTAETCNTYNMLKLSRELFEHNPSVQYADYYENALYNHILASLAPDTGMPNYYVSLKPGHFKTYSSPEGSCWCCTGSGIENTSRYNESIYFHRNDQLWVNLFIPSVLTWQERGLTVTLETEFPKSGEISLKIGGSSSAPTTLNLRVPSWTAGQPVLKINGVVQAISATPGSYLPVTRTWADGDMITFSLPMALKVDRSRDDPSQASILYGPIVLGAELGTQNMPASDQALDNAWQFSAVEDPAVPSLVGSDPAHPDQWIHATTQPLIFSTSASSDGGAKRKELLLKPFYDIHHTRYSVYWDFTSPSSVSTWTGQGNSPAWSATGNWDQAPAEGSGMQFASGSGGSLGNDLAAWRRVSGIGFSPQAGTFVLGGNGITLGGDVINQSGFTQRMNFPITFDGGTTWMFDSSPAGLILGGTAGGTGGIFKKGEGNLVVASDLSLDRGITIDEGSVEVGQGGTSGSIGNSPVSISEGAKLVFNRSDDVTAANNLSGGGSLIKKGAGSLSLTSPANFTGATSVSQGTLRLSSRSAPALLHRWSFNGNLNDSIGAATAQLIDAGANNATLSGTAVTLVGGARAASDYVSLGSGLLPKAPAPLTLELWATSQSFKAWSRIFDLGTSDSENFFMAWSRDTAALNRVEWRDDTTSRVDDSISPYASGAEYHILITIEPFAGTQGTTRVSWYVAPSSSSGLGAVSGSFDTANALADLSDMTLWLGRSHYDADQTANATYNEVRIWNRVFSQSERDQLHMAGPDSIGPFGVQTIFGSLPSGTNLDLAGTGSFDANGQTVSVDSLTAGAGGSVRLNGGKIRIGGTNAGETASFAGAFVGPGTIENYGTLRLRGDAPFPAGVTLINHGVLDVMTWSGELPAGLTNDGTILDRRALKIDAIEKETSGMRLRFKTYRGHRYQVQKSEELENGLWEDMGSPFYGTDGGSMDYAVSSSSDNRRFWRLAVGP